MAEALLHRVGEIAQRAAVAPLGEVDRVAGPETEQVAVVVQQLLDMVLKGDYFLVLLEDVVDLLVRDEAVQAIGAVRKYRWYMIPQPFSGQSSTRLVLGQRKIFLFWAYGSYAMPQ